MHTLKVIGGGFLLLIIAIAVDRVALHKLHTRPVMFGFILIWLLLSLWNMCGGVKHAGYSLRDELPIFFVVLLVPSLVAVAYLYLGR